jgi:hypothetical protein
MTNLKKLGVTLVAVALVFAYILSSTGSVEASARDANWVVAVTYQNVGDAPATLVVNFYAENSATPVPFDPLNGGTLAPGAGRSFFIGNVAVPAGFQGNAVMNSDQPLVSTVVQFSQDPGFKMRLLYNGFQASKADDTYFVATVLKNKFDRTSVFSIQNTEDADINVTVSLYDADSPGNPPAVTNHAIPAMSSKYIDMDDPADTGVAAPVFNGSAIIQAELAGGGGPANVVAAVDEYYITSNIAAAFEGLPLADAAGTIYMSTGLCQRFGLDTFYAVTNASLTDSTDITVQYYDTGGTPVATDGPYTVGAGEKRSIRTCDPNDGTDMTAFTGSAVITSTATDIVVIGKAQNSLLAGTPGTAELFTAFMGESVGSSELAVPFVRWASDAQFNDPGNTGERQRSFLAIQNLENSAIEVDAEYYDKDGNLVGTHTLTIPANSKGNTNASLAGVLGAPGMVPGAFGYYQDGSFGAAVLIKAGDANPGAQFIAINRTQHPGAGEDVNGAPTQ